MSLYVYILMTRDLIDLEGLSGWLHIPEFLTIIKMLHNFFPIYCNSSLYVCKLLIASQFNEDVLSFSTGCEFSSHKHNIKLK
jgi:hypothetical protein